MRARSRREEALSLVGGKNSSWSITDAHLTGHERLRPVERLRQTKPECPCS